MDSLEQMLEDYRNGERGLPSYEELCSLVDAAAPQVVADITPWQDRMSAYVKQIADLRAAPVQAQEPVARKKTPNPFPEGSPNENWRRGYEGVRHFGAPDSQAATHWKMGRAARKADDATLVQPVTVPDSWKLVPIEPTREMLEAWVSTPFESRAKMTAREVREGRAKAEWQAMLVVAPDAPAAQGDALNIAQIEDGYEGGTCIADPTRLGGTVHLHYISPEHAESAFEVIAEMIDAVIVAKATS